MEVEWIADRATLRSPAYEGVSLSKGEKYTRSKTECLADLLLWLPKRIEEKGFEVWSTCSLIRSSMRSVLSRMLICLYKPIYLLSVQNSGLDMLTPQ